MSATPEEDREIISPQAGLERRGEHAGSQVQPGGVDERVLLVWGTSLLERALRYCRAEATATFAGEAEIHRGVWGGVPVTVVAPGIGGPATALVVDKLQAAGARGFVGAGFAGSLHPLLVSGTLLLPESAESDCGTADCYADAGDRLEATPAVKEALEAALGHEYCRFQCATVWTTDAIYRETVAKARDFRSRGCAGVDMETAALFAVAKRRGLHAGAVLVLADELCRFAPLDVETPDDLVWEWRPAKPGSLEGPAGAMLRGAFGAVTGFSLEPPASTG